MKKNYVFHLSVLIVSYVVFSCSGEDGDMQTMSREEIINAARQAGAQAAEQVFKERRKESDAQNPYDSWWSWKKIILGSGLLGSSSILSGIWWGCRKFKTDVWGLSNLSVNALNAWFNQRILGKVETLEQDITQLKEENKKAHAAMKNQLNDMEQGQQVIFATLVDIDNGQTQYCDAFNSFYRSMNADHDGLKRRYYRMHEDIIDIADRMATAHDLKTGLSGVESAIDESCGFFNLRFDDLTKEVRELRFAAENIIKSRGTPQGVFYINIAGCGRKQVPFY